MFNPIRALISHYSPVYIHKHKDGSAGLVVRWPVRVEAGYSRGPATMVTAYVGNETVLRAVVGAAQITFTRNVRDNFFSDVLIVSEGPRMEYEHIMGNPPARAVGPFLVMFATAASQRRAMDEYRQKKAREEAASPTASAN